MKNIKYIINVFVIGLILGAGGVYLLTSQSNSSTNLDGTANPNNTNSDNSNPNNISRLKKQSSRTPGVREEGKKEGVLYTNSQYGFSFRYPEGLLYKEFDEGGGSQTIVFQVPGDAKTSFQIYITPYTESTITGERILYDIPSGNVRDLEEIQLTEDLLVATFISNDVFLGDTKEIWFIDGKHLYQATTFVNLDSWLTNIISTWKFNN